VGKQTGSGPFTILEVSQSLVKIRHQRTEGFKEKAILFFIKEKYCERNIGYEWQYQMKYEN